MIFSFETVLIIKSKTTFVVPRDINEEDSQKLWRGESGLGIA